MFMLLNVDKCTRFDMKHCETVFKSEREKCIEIIMKVIMKYPGIIIMLSEVLVVFGRIIL